MIFQEKCFLCHILLTDQISSNNYKINKNISKLIVYENSRLEQNIIFNTKDKTKDVYYCYVTFLLFFIFLYLDFSLFFFFPFSSSFNTFIVVTWLSFYSSFFFIFIFRCFSFFWFLFLPMLSGSLRLTKKTSTLSKYLSNMALKQHY